MLWWPLGAAHFLFWKLCLFVNTPICFAKMGGTPAWTWFVKIQLYWRGGLWIQTCRREPPRRRLWTKAPLLWHCAEATRLICFFMASLREYTLSCGCSGIERKGLVPLKLQISLIFGFEPSVPCLMGRKTLDRNWEMSKFEFFSTLRQPWIS